MGAPGGPGRTLAPVYPGETWVTELWRDGALASLRMRVAEREAVVLDHGRAVLAA